MQRATCSGPAQRDWPSHRCWFETNPCVSAGPAIVPARSLIVGGRTDFGRRRRFRFDVEVVPGLVEL
jgi:hypothetical protein